MYSLIPHSFHKKVQPMNNNFKLCLLLGVLLSSFFIKAQDFNYYLKIDTTVQSIAVHNNHKKITDFHQLKIYTGHFDQALQQSELKDKILISKVLRQYDSKTKYWKEVLNMGKTYRAVAELLNNMVDERLRIHYTEEQLKTIFSQE